MSALGHEQTSRRVRVMSVIPLKADIRHCIEHVCFVPKADCRLSTRPRLTKKMTGVLNSRPSASVLFDRCQDGRTLVLNEDDEKLRGLRFAGVATDNVNVIGTFIEGLTRVKGDRVLSENHIRTYW